MDMDAGKSGTAYIIAEWEAARPLLRNRNWQLSSREWIISGTTVFLRFDLESGQSATGHWRPRLVPTLLRAGPITAAQKRHFS